MSKQPKPASVRAAIGGGPPPPTDDEAYQTPENAKTAAGRTASKEAALDMTATPGLDEGRRSGGAGRR